MKKMDILAIIRNSVGIIFLALILFSFVNLMNAPRYESTEDFISVVEENKEELKKIADDLNETSTVKPKENLFEYKDINFEYISEDKFEIYESGNKKYFYVTYSAEEDRIIGANDNLVKFDLVMLFITSIIIMEIIFLGAGIGRRVYHHIHSHDDYE